MPNGAKTQNFGWKGLYYLASLLPVFPTLLKISLLKGAMVMNSIREAAPFIHTNSFSKPRKLVQEGWKGI